MITRWPQASGAGVAMQPGHRRPPVARSTPRLQRQLRQVDRDRIVACEVAAPVVELDDVADRHRAGRRPPGRSRRAARSRRTPRSARSEVIVDRLGRRGRAGAAARGDRRAVELARQPRAGPRGTAATPRRVAASKTSPEPDAEVATLDLAERGLRGPGPSCQLCLRPAAFLAGSLDLGAEQLGGLNGVPGVEGGTENMELKNSSLSG